MWQYWRKNTMPKPSSHLMTGTKKLDYGSSAARYKPKDHVKQKESVVEKNPSYHEDNESRTQCKTTSSVCRTVITDEAMTLDYNALLIFIVVIIII